MLKVFFKSLIVLGGVFIYTTAVASDFGAMSIDLVFQRVLLGLIIVLVGAYGLDFTKKYENFKAVEKTQKEEEATTHATMRLDESNREKAEIAKVMNSFFN